MHIRNKKDYDFKDFEYKDKVFHNKIDSDKLITEDNKIPKSVLSEITDEQIEFSDGMSASLILFGIFGLIGLVWGGVYYLNESVQKIKYYDFTVEEFTHDYNVNGSNNTFSNVDFDGYLFKLPIKDLETGKDAGVETFAVGYQIDDYNDTTGEGTSDEKNTYISKDYINVVNSQYGNSTSSIDYDYKNTLSSSKLRIKVIDTDKKITKLSYLVKKKYNIGSFSQDKRVVMFIDKKSYDELFNKYFKSEITSKDSNVAKELKKTGYVDGKTSFESFLPNPVEYLSEKSYQEYLKSKNFADTPASEINYEKAGEK